jgi:hypothetical protein
MLKMNNLKQIHGIESLDMKGGLTQVGRRKSAAFHSPSCGGDSPGFAMISPQSDAGLLPAPAARKSPHSRTVAVRETKITYS